ncbi:DinB superfamily protein [Stigmatella aurantiaca]|uniref:DinB superfamily protein n=1 Tax=Stigmatella aurantiaca TaxID=41 RepID=A0A1H8BZ55_STIAU|nr:DinB family protein [Stigmatella aurantiaca]SEM88063.1 DinB superfamily protein [Stigmatella aurantiaca]
MANPLKDTLLGQLETAWALTRYHLEGLTTEECLRRPAQVGLHVNRGADGHWRADWPEHEGYSLGPASIAWLTWHLGFWWSMVQNHSFGDASLQQQQVSWPGTAEEVRAWLTRLHAGWRTSVDQLGDEDLRSTGRTRWPLKDRPFADIVAWVNLELMKNAAEIGYARFVLAVSERSG